MRQIIEKFEVNTILKLLSSSLPYYLKSWQERGEDMGLFGSTNPRTFNMNEVNLSSPVIEYVIRPHINILCILAAYIHKDYFSDQTSTILNREQAISYVKKGLSWLCATHVTGTRDEDDFLERKRWGENWRSSLWTSLIGICFYLTKEVLDEELTERIKEVIAFEANRFIGVTPPSGYSGDTKLEENSQDVMILAWAINLLSDHPNRKEWEKSLDIWGINIATSIHDKANYSEYCGKSISYWTKTQTLYPDMTAENHGYFNPEILSYTTWVVLSIAAYSLHHNQIPYILQWKNHQQTFDILLRFCLPTGIIYTPGGTDLPFFIPHPFALAWGLWNNDPRAQRMASTLIDWMECKLKNENSTHVPWVRGFNGSYDGWELLFQSQAGLEIALLAILPFPQEQRFYSMGQIESAVDTNKIYPYIQMCYRRNTRTTRSVAWKALAKHPVIGINIHSYSELLTPYNANLLGIPMTDTNIKSWEVIFHNDFLKKSGFDTYGRINYYSGTNERVLHRDVRVLTWGDDGIIVFDRIFADIELYFYDQYLSPLYLVNDHWTRNKLDLISGSLRETIYAEKSFGRSMNCPSFWASVENTILLQFVWGRTKGLTYIPGTKKNAPRYWNNCRLDMLGVYAEGRLCSPGDIAYEIGLFIGAGKGPRPFKSAGSCGEYFKGIVVMDGKSTIGLD